MTKILSWAVKEFIGTDTELDVAGITNESMTGGIKSGAALVVKIKSDEVARLCEA